MNIKAIFFDIGGVLLRTQDRTSRQQLATRLGMSNATLEELVFEAESGQQAQLGVIPAWQHWQSLARRLGLPYEQIPAFRRDFFGGDRLDIELLDYLRSLHQDYRTGLITNAFDDVRQPIFEEWKLGDIFDHIVISAEVGVMKPDGRIYRLALQGLGVAAGEAVFVDDMQPNVEGARAVGMHAIRFQNTEQTRADLERLLENSNQ